MADLDSLSDAELRKKLSEYNFPAAAITGTTRKIYIKKLKQLMDQSVLNDTAPNRSSAKFSSGESSEDELKKPATRSKKNTPSKVISPAKTTRRRSPGRSAGNYNGETHTFSGDEQVDNAHDSPSINASLENRSSLLNKVPSRRSLHPDSDLSFGRAKSQLPAYENGLNADLEGTNRSFTSSASRLSRGLDGSLLFPSATLSEGRFKSRFLNNDNTTSSLAAKPLSDSNFISELKSRYGGNKSASSTFTSRFGNEVKESDDEDHIASTVSHSTSTRPRYHKWSAAENPWWKNSSVVSMSLVGVLGVFFLIIFLFYLSVTRKDAAISSPGF